MIWIVSIITIIFALCAIAEQDQEAKRSYTHATIGGLISLGISAAM